MGLLFCDGGCFAMGSFRVISQISVSPGNIPVSTGAASDYVGSRLSFYLAFFKEQILAEHFKR
jgi:hypothetical protein